MLRGSHRFTGTGVPPESETQPTFAAYKNDSEIELTPLVFDLESLSVRFLTAASIVVNSDQGGCYPRAARLRPGTVRLATKTIQVLTCYD